MLIAVVVSGLAAADEVGELAGDVRLTAIGRFSLSSWRPNRRGERSISP